VVVEVHLSREDLIFSKKSGAKILEISSEAGF